MIYGMKINFLNDVILENKIGHLIYMFIVAQRIMFSVSSSVGSYLVSILFTGVFTSSGTPPAIWFNLA